MLTEVQAVLEIGYIAELSQSRRLEQLAVGCEMELRDHLGAIADLTGPTMRPATNDREQNREFQAVQDMHRDDARKHIDHARALLDAA